MYLYLCSIYHNLNYNSSLFSLFKQIEYKNNNHLGFDKVSNQIKICEL